MPFFNNHPNRLRILIGPVLATIACIYGYNRLTSSEAAPQRDIITQPDQKSPDRGIISVENTIRIEELFKKSLSFKVQENEENELDIWYHDGAGLTLNQFDSSGKHIHTISLPTIDEPIGINRISDFFIYSADSIFVYDAQYRKLLLVNHESEVLNLWLINNFVPELSTGRNNEIIDIYKNTGGELKIDLTGFDHTYYQSDPNFSRYNSFVYQINLDTKVVNRGISYPESSAYKDYLFWSGIVPYVRKTDMGYIATFPLDEQVYRYDHDLTPQGAVTSDAKDFPRAVGNPYGSAQKMNFARIDRKLNGFNLKTRGIFNTDHGQKFAKVYRAPLGDDDRIPDDYASFLQGNYVSEHYLQVFDVKGDEFTKRYYDIEVGEMNLGNLLYIDRDNRYYFLKNDPESEEREIVICSISTEKSSPETSGDEIMTDIP